MEIQWEPIADTNGPKSNKMMDTTDNIQQIA